MKRRGEDYSGLGHCDPPAVSSSAVSSVPRTVAYPSIPATLANRSQLTLPNRQPQHPASVARLPQPPVSLNTSLAQTQYQLPLVAAPSLINPPLVQAQYQLPLATTAASLSNTPLPFGNQYQVPLTTAIPTTVITSPLVNSLVRAARPTSLGLVATVNQSQLSTALGIRQPPPHLVTASTTGFLQSTHDTAPRSASTTYSVTRPEMPHQIAGYPGASVISSGAANEVASGSNSNTSSNMALTSSAAATTTTVSATAGAGVSGAVSTIPANLHHIQQRAVPMTLSAAAAVPITMSAAAVANHSSMQQTVQSLGGGAGGQFQRLKVEDALSYLDQVKLRFGKQPHVYNDFLDIMKEFKSQSIDTPGVIGRVSQLFRGHPELIVGFNTFLPPGYKIEVNVNIPGQHTTVVHTPQGTQQHITSTSVVLHNASHIHTILHQQPSQSGQQILQTSQGVSVKPQQSLPMLQQSRGVSVVGGSTTTGTSPDMVSSSSNCAPSPAPPPPQQRQGSVITQQGILSSQQLSPSLRLPCNTAPVVSPQLTAPIGSTQVTPQPMSQSLLSTNTAPVTNQMQTSLQAVQAAVTAGLHQQPSQPVEFDHAINYVNKIKLRFQTQPDIYKQFLEILHTYQKEQRCIKEGGTPQGRPGTTLTEKEVYEKVAKLFENQEDLLQEFSQFLPDATNNTVAQAAVSEYYLDQCNRTPLAVNKTADHPVSGVSSTTNTASNSNSFLSSLSSAVSIKALPSDTVPAATTITTTTTTTTTTSQQDNINSETPLSPPSVMAAQQHTQAVSPSNAPCSSNQLKRTGTTLHPQQPPVKKPKVSYLKDMSTADAAKYATLAEYDFFDQVRKALRHEETYHNFLRCITIYNEEVVSRCELVQLVRPFLAKFPDLFKWFNDFVSGPDGSAINNCDVIPSSIAKQERISGDLAMEIDYSTCKRLGASYCALPKSWPQEKCSGRTKMCGDVLNDTWVSFPSWSEDATFVSSRKTMYEEFIYRCEDERFELDVVLESNLATTRVLEAVQRKLNRMSPEDATKFRLDDGLGGSSPTIHQKAIRRIYGDKAQDIIDGLKKNPMVAVPLVLRRLKLKDEEWREAQKNFNKLWREQNEKYYFRSLDHQGINFKQNDVKMTRSKSLLNDIETLFDERHDQAEESGKMAPGPHMTLQYPAQKFIMTDAATLIIHHVKRQTTIHKEDKAKIKQLVRHFIPDLLFHDRQDLSDDEKEDEEDEEEELEPKIEDNELDDDNNTRTTRERECKQVCSASNSNGSDSNSSNTTKRKTRSTKHSIEADTENSDKVDTSRVKDKDKEESNSSSDIKEDDSSPPVNGIVNERVAIKEEEDIKMEQMEEEVTSVVGGNYTLDDEYRLFMCNNNWYIFLRLHQLLCHRLYRLYQQAIQLAAQEAKDSNGRSQNIAQMLRLKPRCDIPMSACYPAVLEMVCNLLDGNLDYNAYEDSLRETFTIHAYPAFTLDKVVGSTVRQLQHLVCDEAPSQCTASYLTEGRRGGAGGTVSCAAIRLPLEQAYCSSSEKMLNDENCFKIYSYKRSGTITIELVDSEMDEENNNTAGDNNNNSSATNDDGTVYPGLPAVVADAQGWAEYVEQYLAASAETASMLPSHMFIKAVFLMRNLHIWRNLTQQRICSQKRHPIHIEDNTQCKFNLASFKAVFVVNSESCLYKKHALHRARNCHEKVTLRKRVQFERFHRAWTRENVSDSESRATNAWFMGRCEGLKPNRTHMAQVTSKGRSPFGTYNHYTYTMLDTTNTAS